MARQFRSDDTSAWIPQYGNGSAGALSQNTATDTTANTGFDGGAGGTSATVGSGTGFSNGDLVLIHQTQRTGAGNWELNKISSGGGTTSWTMAYPLINTYTTTPDPKGGQVYLLKQYTTATINSGQTFTGQSWGGVTGGILAILANVSITITGNITVNGNAGTTWSTAPGSGGQTQGIGFVGGNAYENNNSGAAATAWQGDSATGTGTQSTAANGQAGGGGSSPGGSYHYSSGGGGGYATGGGTGQFLTSGTGGVGGGTAGNAGLTTVFFGGPGGGGVIAGSGDSGAGGSGGGFVLLIAPIITVTGGISANGGVGGNGGNICAGGGGSGGAILLKGEKIVLGTTLVTAQGASGGKDAIGGGGTVRGGNGGDGRIHADYGISLSGTTSPTIDSRQDKTLIAENDAFFFSYI